MRPFIARMYPRGRTALAARVNSVADVIWRHRRDRGVSLGDPITEHSQIWKHIEARSAGAAP